MIIVPDLKTQVNSSEFLRSQDVDAIDFKSKIEEQNRIYARSQGQSAGRIFQDAWTTFSTSYTTDPHVSYQDDLKTWSGLLFLERPGENGEINVRFKAYGSGIDIRATLTRFNDDGTTSVYNASFSSPASYGHFGGLVSFTNFTRRSNSTASNDPAPFILSIEARSQSATIAGRLDSFIFFEDVLTAGLMP